MFVLLTAKNLHPIWSTQIHARTDRYTHRESRDVCARRANRDVIAIRRKTITNLMTTEAGKMTRETQDGMKRANYDFERV